jgi:hypothetical protein
MTIFLKNLALITILSILTIAYGRISHASTVVSMQQQLVYNLAVIRKASSDDYDCGD